MWIANSFVIAVTAALFLLWFRYICSLLLAAQTSLDRSEDFARANSLAFAHVLQELQGKGEVSPDQLDRFTHALARDFEVVTYLLSHMGHSLLGHSPTEAWMLKADYRIQNWKYRLLGRFSRIIAQRQVSQMALIICHFADLVGERSVPAEA